MDDLAPRRLYRLPVALRTELAEPWGPVLGQGEVAARLRPGDVIVTVGDVVSLTALDLKVTPRLMVVDGRTQRGPLSREGKTVLARFGVRVPVSNPPATLTRTAWMAVRKALRDPAAPPTRIDVDGEEDLVGIPCFLEAPDGAVVLYGIPNRGIAFVRVDDKVRARVAGLVQRFEQDGRV